MGFLIASIGGGMAYWYIAQTQTQTTIVQPTTNIAPVAVMALGRLEPEGEVIKLSVANAQDSRVNQLLCVLLLGRSLFGSFSLPILRKYFSSEFGVSS